MAYQKLKRQRGQTMGQGIAKARILLYLADNYNEESEITTRQIQDYLGIGRAQILAHLEDLSQKGLVNKTERNIYQRAVFNRQKKDYDMVTIANDIYWSINTVEEKFEEIFSIMEQYQFEYAFLKSAYYKNYAPKYIKNSILKKTKLKSENFGYKELDFYIFNFSMYPHLTTCLFSNKELVSWNDLNLPFTIEQWQRAIPKIPSYSQFEGIKIKNPKLFLFVIEGRNFNISLEPKHQEFVNKNYAIATAIL